jgi:hypothetical protein
MKRKTNRRKTRNEKMVETLVKIKTGYNSTYPKGGFSCFKDSFVVKESSELRN